MPKAIDRICEKLKNYPEVQYEQKDRSIIIFPKDAKGFPVSLFVHSDTAFTVYFDAWHEEFTQVEAALECFSFGLSNQCRLKVSKRGEKAYKWTVEYKQDGHWQEDSVTGLFNLAFWKTTSEQYLQNDLIKIEE